MIGFMVFIWQNILNYMKFVFWGHKLHVVVCVVVVILQRSGFLIYPAKAFDSFPKHNFLKIHMHEFENIAQKLLTKTFGFHLAS